MLLLFSYLLKFLSSELKLTLKGLDLAFGGVTPAGVHAETRAAEPAKVMVHADETHSAWAKNDPLSSDF